MTAERISRRFSERRGSGLGGLLPYFTACYPSPDVTIELLKHANALGAPAVEIGFPYSDSIADGPVIQASFNYVLERGHHVRNILSLVRNVRSDVECGIIAMVSFSVVRRLGVATFALALEEAGFDGIILPDIPVEEIEGIREALDNANLCQVGLIAPTTSSARRDAIVRSSTGFVYQIATAGTTGERSSLAVELKAQVTALRRTCPLPIGVGFGISTPQQVRAVCKFADGAIVGSAIVRRMSEGIAQGCSPAAIVRVAGDYLTALASGLDPPNAG